MKKKWLYVIIPLIVAMALLYYFFFRSVTVTYQVGLGPGIHFDKIRINTSVNKPNDPVYDGYKFIGWYLDEEKFDFNSSINKDIVLVAKWEKM